jgi:uncharacterized membrane protein
MNCISRILLALAALHTAACVESPDDTAQTPPAAVRFDGETRVYECPAGPDGFRVVTRSGAEVLALWLPPRFERPYLILQQARSASGSRYEGDGVVVWSKGNEALLEVDGESFRGCTVNRYESIWEHAKLSGVDFRGVGNEPGWVLEIRNSDSIRFSYDYGERVVEVPAPQPESDAVARASTWIGQSDTGPLVVTVEGQTCNDTMSDHNFESTVSVRLGDREFRGCGRALH